MDDLPAMLKPSQAREFLQVSESALRRMLDDGTLPVVKLGTGRSAPLRIPRDKMLQALGLVNVTSDRQKRRQAEAERHRALAGAAKL